MNYLTMGGFILAGGVIATDHLIYRLPHWLAVILYTAAIVLFVTGMIVSKRKNS